MTIMVTGATGQLGGLVVERLAGRVPVSELRVSVRDPGKAEALAERGIEVRQGDFDDPAGLTRTFDGVDTLLLVSTDGPNEVRIAQHANAVAAAERAGVSHLVYTSVTDADTSPLGLATVHARTEARIAESGIPFTFLRNAMYHENYTAQLPQAYQQGALVSCAGDGRIASVSRADLALAAAVVLTEDGHRGATYELTGSSAWSFDQLAALAVEVTGKPLAHKSIPDEELRSILVGPAGLPGFAAEAIVDIGANIRAGALAEVRPDLERLIGRPPTSIAEAVRSVLS
jgi:NAD(P)H dehydrogenase (quinone)